MKALETERLHLRKYQPEDAEPLHRVLFSDPSVCRYFCGGTKTLDEVRRKVAYRIEEYTVSAFGSLAVVRKKDDTLMGLVSLQNCLMWYHRYPDQDPRYNRLEVELAYAFGTAYQKQGYATEACTAVIDHAFREMRLSRIAYGVARDNEPSWRLMQRLGFALVPDLHPEGGQKTIIGILNNTLV